MGCTVVNGSLAYLCSVAHKWLRSIAEQVVYVLLEYALTLLIPMVSTRPHKIGRDMAEVDMLLLTVLTTGNSIVWHLHAASCAGVERHRCGDQANLQPASRSSWSRKDMPYP